MPSWELHRSLSLMICNQSYQEIDRLVDKYLPHDASRYDADMLYEAYKNIDQRYGRVGLCNLVLHHYADRLIDISVLELSMLIGDVSVDAEIDICTRFTTDTWNMVIKDPKNILNLLIAGPDDLIMMLGLLYPGRTHRRSRQHWRKKIKSNYKKLNQTSYSSMSHTLRNVVIDTLNRLESTWTRVLYLVLIDKEFATYIKAAQAIKMKCLSRNRWRWDPSLGGHEQPGEIVKECLEKLTDAVGKLLKCYTG